MASFAAQSDMKREQERLKSVFASARHVQGMKLDGKSSIYSRDLDHFEYAQKGLAGLKLSSDPQLSSAQAFSSDHQHQRGLAAPTIKFAGAQVRDMMLSTAGSWNPIWYIGLSASGTKCSCRFGHYANRPTTQRIGRRGDDGVVCRSIGSSPRCWRTVAVGGKKPGCAQTRTC